MIKDASVSRVDIKENIKEKDKDKGIDNEQIEEEMD